MRKIILYIASGIDGKIAKSDGSIDWLSTIPNPDRSDYGYKFFYQTVDTTIMGYTTYKQVIGFDIPFPYTDKTNYVVTRKSHLKDTNNVSFISREIPHFIETIKNKPGKNIWLIGGGKLNAYFLDEGFIDEIRLFVMPVIMGNGISLFQDLSTMKYLSLVESKTYAGGVVQLIYKKI